MKINLEDVYQKYVFVRDRAMPPIMATLLGVFLILLCDRREPLLVTDLTITPNPARAGVTAYAIFNATTKRACDGEVHRHVVDSGGHVFTLTSEPSIYPSLLAGAKKQFVKAFTVPLGMAPGVAVYHSDLDRWCNLPQQLFWQFHDHYEAEFTVVR